MTGVVGGLGHTVRNEQEDHEPPKWDLLVALHFCGGSRPSESTTWDYRDKIGGVRTEVMLVVNDVRRLVEWVEHPEEGLEPNEVTVVSTPAQVSMGGMQSVTYSSQ